MPSHNPQPPAPVADRRSSGGDTHLSGALVRLDDKPSAVTIRDYRAGDAPVMARIYFIAVYALGTRRTRSRILRGARRRWTANAVGCDSEGAVIGFDNVEANGHIALLYCHSDAAGTGVASGIVAALIDHAQVAGMPDLHVEASKLARGLFERHGFTLAHRRDFSLNGMPIDNHRMIRSLW